MTSTFKVLMRWLAGKRQQISLQDAEKIALRHLETLQSRSDASAFHFPIIISEHAFFYSVRSAPFPSVESFRIDIEDGKILDPDNITPLQASRIAELEMKHVDYAEVPRVGNWDKVVDCKRVKQKYIFIYGPTHPEIVVEVDVLGNIVRKPYPISDR